MAWPCGGSILAIRQVLMHDVVLMLCCSELFAWCTAQYFQLVLNVIHLHTKIPPLFRVYKHGLAVVTRLQVCLYLQACRSALTMAAILQMISFNNKCAMLERWRDLYPLVCRSGCYGTCDCDSFA
jgi:hypothetical protein